MTTIDTTIAPPVPGHPTYNAIMLVRDGKAFVLADPVPGNMTAVKLAGEFTQPGERHRDAAERALAGLVSTDDDAPTLPSHAFCVRHSPQHAGDHRRYTWVVHLDRGGCDDWTIELRFGVFWCGRPEFESRLPWPWRAQGLALVAGLQ